MGGTGYLEGDDEKQIQKPKKTNSKTPILDNFSRDLTKMAADGELEPVVGRDNEVRRISQILSRKKKNNAVIVGDAGVGKCICGDTLVTIKNNLNDEEFKISVNDFIRYHSQHQ